MIQETVDQVRVIQEKIKVVQDRQKSYADQKRMEENFGKKLLLKVSPMKGVIRFGKKGS